jgi:hypothetical protein
MTAAIMSGGHDSHAHDDHSAEVHPHPPIPTITDEASDTPMWVPIAGLALFLVLALFVALRSAIGPGEVAAEAPSELPAAEAPAPAQ